MLTREELLELEKRLSEADDILAAAMMRSEDPLRKKKIRDALAHVLKGLARLEAANSKSAEKRAPDGNNLPPAEL